MGRTLAIIVALAVGAVMLTALGARKRAVQREIEERAHSRDRYLDMGVVLRVVRRDPRGGPDVNGLPPMIVIKEIRLGGMVDLAAARPTLVGPSANPIVWLVSEQQAPLVLHADSEPLWTLTQGSEGAGKTYCLAQWTFLRVLEHLGHDREIGLTAPTTKRMGHVKKAIRKLWRPSWYRWKERDQSYTFLAGPTVQLVSAHQANDAEGSPLQGANWVAHAGDELQDHFDKEPDIETRGRSAPGGRYKRFNSSTSKDSSEWRTFRTACQSSRVWGYHKLLGLDSPFVHPDSWEHMRVGGTMTPREYRRRVLAEDVGPEAQLYHCWARQTDDGGLANLRPLPTATSAIRADDVTAEVLRPWGPNLQLLVGADPGKRQHVSVFIKAFRFASDVRRGDHRPRWFIVDEVTSPDSTVEAHVQEVLKLARTKYRINEAPASLVTGQRPRPIDGARQMLVRIDPHTRSGTEHPGRDVFTIWRSFGILARAAAYAEGSDTPAVIKKESRINLVNTLLCAQAADGEVRRLFVACDDNGKPAAPRVVESFESMERNEAGEAEADKKDANDRSHWSAAVGYALFQVESKHVHRGAA